MKKKLWELNNMSQVELINLIREKELEIKELRKTIMEAREVLARVFYNKCFNGGGKQ